MANWPGHEADRSLPSSADVKHDWRNIRKLDNFSHDTGIT